MRVLLAISVVVISCAGCSKEAPGHTSRARPQVVDPAEAPTIVVHPNSKDMVFRFFPQGQRTADLATRIDKVPVSARDLVIVVPDVEVPAGLVYVADLRKPGADGAFPYKVLDAAEFDRTLVEARGEEPPKIATASTAAAKPKSQPVAGGKNEIILYSTSWCGVCKQAARWMRNKGLPFVEKDIEKQPGARDEMVRNAKAAGMSKSQLNGVPIIYVNGKMLPGFDPRAITNLLKS